jgi:hypothetical protein
MGLPCFVSRESRIGCRVSGVHADDARQYETADTQQGRPEFSMFHVDHSSCYFAHQIPDKRSFDLNLLQTGDRRACGSDGFGSTEILHGRVAEDDD